jgi:glycosyltransferase involved in cell wall biosynthesis
MPPSERGALPSPRLRVAIDLSPAVQGHGGIGRYARELAVALLESDLDLTAFVVDGEGRTPAPPLDRIPAVRRRDSNKAWRLRTLVSSFLGRPMDTVGGSVDVFHGTDHLLPPLRRTASVLTVHDLSHLHVPRTHLPLNRSFLGLMLPRFVRAADAILCVSESTRRDVIATFGADASKVRTAHLGVSALYAPPTPAQVDDARTRYALPDRYLLGVGTLEPRKNLRTLLAAFAALERRDLGLVLVGPRGWRVEEALGGRDLPAAVRDRVRLTGFVPEGDLPALYGGAEAFAYPSVFEGFGLPALVAMACGAPVIASDTTSLPEVVGDAGVLVPPTDVDAWTSALAAVLDDPARRAALRGAGLARARQFTWAKAAAVTRLAYEEAHARRS